MRLHLLLPSVMAAATACTGSIGDVTQQPDVVTAAQCTDGVIRPGPAPLRRLTRLEYDNTIANLLGDTTHPARRGLQTDGADPNGYDNEAKMQGLGNAAIEAFADVAEDVATRAVATSRGRLLACDAGAADCGQMFIARFGRKAFRRPLTTDELDRYSDFFAAARASYDFDTALRMSVQAMLQSPQFLYRIESVPNGAKEGDVVPLDAHAIASRLSYTILRSMPDDELFAAADTGKLATVEGIEAEARRLLATQDAKEALHDFFDQWLRIPQVASSAKTDPSFNNAVGAAMVEESHRFIDDVVWSEPDLVTSLLTATHSFVNGALAKFYGIPNVEGDDFVRVELDPAVRKGILTRGAWLTANATDSRTKPVTRGVFIERKLLCNALGDPPPNAARAVDNTDDNGQIRSVRDSFGAHLADPSCAACHSSVDALGFAFESFGPTGMPRTNDDNGFAADTSGALPESAITGATASATEPTVDFSDASQLISLLATSDRVSNCFVQQQLELGLGRTLVGEDACAQASVLSAWTAARYDFKELMVALVRSDAFRYRRVVAADLN